MVSSVSSISTHLSTFRDGHGGTICPNDHPISVCTLLRPCETAFSSKCAGFTAWTQAAIQASINKANAWASTGSTEGDEDVSAVVFGEAGERDMKERGTEAGIKTSVLWLDVEWFLMHDILAEKRQPLPIQRLHHLFSNHICKIRDAMIPRNTRKMIKEPSTLLAPIFL